MEDSLQLKFTIPFVALSALLLSGCASPAEQARARAQYQAQLDARAHNYCSSELGLERGSQAYANCRIQVEQIRQQEAARNAARQQRAGQALINMGNRISQCGISGQYC